MRQARSTLPAIVSVGAAILALSGCGGGAAGSLLPAAGRPVAPPAPQGQRDRGAAILRVAVSPTGSAAKSIAMFVFDPLHRLVATVKRDLTPGSCTLPIALAPGSYSADLIAYARTGATGGML